MKVANGIFISFGLVSVVAGSATAATRHVPADYPTIGAALAACEPGDDVLIAPGTYREHDLVIPDRVTLVGEHLNTVVIDAQGAGRVLAVTDPTASVTIAGVDLIGGDAARGGGFYSNGRDVRLHAVRIVGNVAAYGGGVYIDGGFTRLLRCDVSSNRARAVGGGVFARGDGRLDLVDCAIVLNAADGYAGGWYAAMDAGLLVFQSTVADNSAPTAAEGGAFAAGEVDMESTAIASNCAPHPPVDCNGGATTLVVDQGSVPQHDHSLRDVHGWTGAIADQAGVNDNLAADPLFCRAGGPADLPQRYGVAADSPVLPENSGFYHRIGAFEQACDAVTDVDDALPAAASALFAPSPNPFNPSTTIRFSLREPGSVRLAVFDLAGRRVATLLDEHLTAGSHEVNWRGVDDAGLRVASGIYFCRLQAAGLTHNRRLALVK